MSSSPPAALTVEPIGVVRSPYREPSDAPRQPRAAAETTGVIELWSGQGFEFALRDLEPGQYLWVLFWFHRAQGWRPTVRPPRSPVRRGVFATRAPHRPNPIGLSAVELLAVDGLKLTVRGVDMLDGTPVLDLKPYLAYTDAIVDADAGWLAAPADPGPTFEVTFAELAQQQLDFLRSERGLELAEGIGQTLSLGPSPHPYRRIKADGDGFLLAHKEWRAHFRVDGQRVLVTAIATGFRARELADTGRPELDAHRVFVARYGYPGHG